MRLKIYSFLLALFLISGLHAEEKKEEEIGALSQMRDFEVCAFFSSTYEEDSDLLFSAFVDCFKKIGNVEIIDQSKIKDIADTTNLLLISVEASPEERAGSMHLISKVEVAANQFKKNCSIWQLDFQEKNRAYPTIENGAIIFKQDEDDAHAEYDEDETEAESNASSVIHQLVGNFGREYYRLNSKDEKPSFRIYTPVFIHL